VITDLIDSLTKAERLVLDEYMTQTIDTRDIRVSYLTVTGLGNETLKKQGVIKSHISHK
jgi:hypothetical protein